MLRIKPILIFLSLILLTVMSCKTTPPGSPSGNLFIIGGGDRPQYMMDKIVALAGGENASILIIPNASYDAEEAGQSMQAEFEKLGVRQVDYLALKAGKVDTKANLKKLKGVTGVYFTGGDQSRLTDLMTGSKLLERIHDRYREGAVISGTSAGAAIMSEIMITGNELINTDTNQVFGTIQSGNVEHVKGFGFVTEAIIDQHFIKRKRLNRLITLVLENPKLIGVGIDESTAIWVKPDRTFEVMGESQVMIFDARDAQITKTETGQFRVGGMKTSLLLNGDSFDMNTEKPATS